MLSEISVTELDQKIKSDSPFILLDVREQPELGQACIQDSRLESAPMSRLASEGTAALSEAVRSQQVPVYVLCHHGIRSVQVVYWLEQQGYSHAVNVRGGIDEYARRVDPSIGIY